MQPDFDALICNVLSQNLANARPRPADEPGTVSLETGLIFARTVMGVAPAALEPPPAPARVEDGAGHSRPIYRALLVYAWLRAAVGTPGDRWQNQMMRWCESIENDLGEASAPMHAQDGWNALALHVAAKPLDRADWIARAAQTFDRLAQGQQQSGALLPPMPQINPETRWYDELVLLHAMSTYGIQTRDPAIESAVRRATEFHLMETQPDHATQQPWAVFAFLSNPDTRIQGEQILDAAIMRNSSNLDAISLILLADALWCMRARG
jgi:hypothetical protein